MDEYEKLVERCRADRISKRIENASISHARVLFRNLFVAAKSIPSGEPRELVIQSRAATPSFYEEFAGDAKDLMGFWG